MREEEREEKETNENWSRRAGQSGGRAEAAIDTKLLRYTRQRLAEPRQTDSRETREQAADLNSTVETRQSRSHSRPTMYAGTVTETTEAKWSPWATERRLDNELRRYGVKETKHEVMETYPDGSSRFLELAPLEELPDGATELAFAISHIDPAMGHSAVLWNRATRLIYGRAWIHAHPEKNRRNVRAFRERQRQKKLAALIAVQAEARAE